MKVEVVSIGTELLTSDILDTNAAYISRSLREVDVNITCKVTVGDDPDMIADALQVALRRADVVLVTGGLGEGEDDFTRQAVAKATGRELLADPIRVTGSSLLGGPDARATALLVEEETGVLICLPGNRREMAYLLETEALPYLQERLSAKPLSNWILLRTVGVMESNLKKQLADLTFTPRQRISLDSFAGQTDIRLWVEADSEEQVQSELEQLKQAVLVRLGDHVYGEGKERLEDVILDSLIDSGIKLAVAECYTGRILARTLQSVPGFRKVVVALPTATWTDLADYLQLEESTPERDLTRWCRQAAERLRAVTESDLGLVLYSNITRGGVQVLGTLASPHGVSVTQRSFGGHPDNINQWACTLGLAHLRRWLLAYE